MAIDTEDKRRSVSGYAGAKIAPLADASVDDADRFQIGWIYAGTTPDAPVVPTGAMPMAVHHYRIRRA